MFHKKPRFVFYDADGSNGRLVGRRDGRRYEELPTKETKPNNEVHVSHRPASQERASCSNKDLANDVPAPMILPQVMTGHRAPATAHAEARRSPHSRNEMRYSQSIQENMLRSQLETITNQPLPVECDAYQQSSLPGPSPPFHITLSTDPGRPTAEVVVFASRNYFTKRNLDMWRHRIPKDTAVYLYPSSKSNRASFAYYLPPLLPQTQTTANTSGGHAESPHQQSGHSIALRDIDNRSRTSLPFPNPVDQDLRASERLLGNQSSLRLNGHEPRGRREQMHGEQFITQAARLAKDLEEETSAYDADDESGEEFVTVRFDNELLPYEVSALRSTLHEHDSTASGRTYPVDKAMNRDTVSTPRPRKRSFWEVVG